MGNYKFIGATGVPTIINWWKKRGIDPSNVSVRDMDYRWPFLYYEEFVRDKDGYRIFDDEYTRQFLTRTRRRLTLLPPWFMVEDI